MSYVSSVASDNLMKTPKKVVENWPFILLFSATEALTCALGRCEPARRKPYSNFWDPDTLRVTLWGSLAQGIQDTVNSNIWGFGYMPAPQSSIPTGEDVGVSNTFGAYY